MAVDTGVTHPYIWDFYLQAQAGLVGTACPAHYVALLDENGFNSDSMQRLVNSMCYSFARATRSVSLIPVAYYADIVCTKSRSFGKFLSPLDTSDTDDTLSTQSTWTTTRPPRSRAPPPSTRCTSRRSSTAARVPTVSVSLSRYIPHTFHSSQTDSLDFKANMWFL